MLTFRVEGMGQDQNDAQLLLSLDQLEEKRQQMQICITALPTADPDYTLQEGDVLGVLRQRPGPKAHDPDHAIEGSRKAETQLGGPTSSSLGEARCRTH